MAKTDVDFIKEHPVLLQIFESCTEEISLMSSTKFYSGYSYCDVLKMAKNMKKLVNLTKNRELVSSFEANLCQIYHYEDDLRRIWAEAIQLRDEVEAIEFRLVHVFGKVFPDIVIRKLRDNVSLDDCNKIV